jgi:Lrp/AsnC family transcriptional regulator, leucine-responsive regulatory protein
MASAPLDGIDRKILRQLQEDGRLPNVELADRVGLSPSPALRRVKQLEDDGVIRGYRAVVDRKKVGLGLTVFVSMSAQHHSRDEISALGATLAAMPEVVAVHMVSGQADFLVEAVVADLEGYESWLTDRLLTAARVDNVRSYFSIRTLKDDAPLPIGG